MQGGAITRFCAALGALIALAFVGLSSNAQTVKWGVNGAGGSGNWDTTTANWFNGAGNVTWPSGGNAIFGGASGGTVNDPLFPIVSSMTFNTPGYTIQDGGLESGAMGLTVTTNVAATIGSLLTETTSAGNFLVKNGPAALTLSGTNFLGAVQVNQGELRVTDSASTLFFSNVTLANTPGATVTLAPNGGASAGMQSLAGGGTLGGVVQPSNQAGTVTLDLYKGGTFGGTLQNNGVGTLALDLFAPPGASETLTNASTYSGATTIDSGTLDFAGNGSAASSRSILVYDTLSLDNSGTVLANRLSNSAPIAVNGGAIQLIGNATTPVEEAVGQLSFAGASTITVSQSGSAAAQLTFAGLDRLGHATLNIVGPGVEFMGLANGSTGIVAPYITAGNEWATVGGDGRITAWTTYATDVNSGSTSDHVKLTASGTTSLAAATTRSSLNLQNSNGGVGQVLDLAGQNLQLTSGGILSSGTGASTIQNGSLSTPAQEMVVTANNNLTIRSSITDGGSSTTLTKSGTGVLTLTGTNTYTGPTAITQGTLVVASDANLGLGPTIDLGSGTLQAAASFASAKGLASDSAHEGSVDTAGFNVAFSGPSSVNVTKAGLGTLTLSNAVSGFITLQSGTLQVAGTLTELTCSPAPGPNTPVLDIGGPAAATLTTSSFSFFLNSSGNLRINFGIGSASSDFWAIPFDAMFPTNAGAFQFEFQNLGGVKTGVDYPLMSFFAFSAPPPSIFAFAPDMAAAGRGGTFKTTSSGVSVRFSSVPEPSVTAVMLLQGAVFAFAARRRRRNRKKRVRPTRDCDSQGLR